MFNLDSLFTMTSLLWKSLQNSKIRTVKEYFHYLIITPFALWTRSWWRISTFDRSKPRLSVWNVIAFCNDGTVIKPISIYILYRTVFLSCMPPWRDVHSATPWFLLWMPTRFHWDKMWRSVILGNEEYTKPNCIYEDSKLLWCLVMRVISPKWSLFLAFWLSVDFSELSMKLCINLRLALKIWTILQPYKTGFFCRVLMRFFSIKLKDSRYYELTFNLYLKFWALLEWLTISHPCLSYLGGKTENMKMQRF